MNELKNYFLLAEYEFPEYKIRVVQNKYTKGFYSIVYKGNDTTLRQLKEEDVLDYMLAQAAYKNEVYNLQGYPQVKDLFKEEK